ncbi:protein kinase [Streptomyces sp. M19]
MAPAAGQPSWLVSRYVPGLPLSRALRAYGPLPVPAALRLLRDTARALAAVHEAGVVHRDVKPGNVLLAADGPWLLDFGVARAAADITVTTMGHLVGTRSTCRRSTPAVSARPGVGRLRSRPAHGGGAHRTSSVRRRARVRGGRPDRGR